MQAYLSEQLTLDQYSVLNGADPWGNFIGVLTAWQTPDVSRLQPPNIPLLKGLLSALHELRSMVRRTLISLMRITGEVLFYAGHCDFVFTHILCKRQIMFS